MITIGKVSAAAAGYFEGEVASGAEDYYAGGEKAGVWVGSLAADLGLEGAVSLDPGANGKTELANHLGQSHPVSGEFLGAEYSVGGQVAQRSTALRPGVVDRAKVGGFDATFSVPKSVSALYACADVEVRVEIQAAIDEAVGAVVSHLEAHAAFSRCGKGGRLVSKASGLSIARFDHRTSRAGDPQLHSHLLIANRVRRIGTDGKEGWGTLDGRVLYAEAKTAGMVGQAVLREAMTRRLGVGWTPVSVHGQADIEGVDAGLVSLWSKRHHAVDTAAERLIEGKEEVLGRSLTVHERMGIRADAVLATRTVKTPGIEGADLLGSWKAEARAYGFDPDRVAGVVTSPPVGGLPAVLDVAMVTDAVLDVLVECRASFGVTDVRRAVLAVCPATTGRDAVQVGHLVELATRAVLSHPSIVTVVEGGQAVPSGIVLDDATTVVDDGTRTADVATVGATSPGHDAGHADGVAGGMAEWPSLTVSHLQRFTTSEVLAAELSVLDWATSPATSTTVGVVGDLSGLDESQVAAVRTVVESSAAVSVVVGPAGAGKSAAMSRVVDALSGVPVRGVAVSQAAAVVLAEETGLGRCDNLAKWRHEYDTAVKRGEGTGVWGLAAGEVVIVDEASMLGTADWVWLKDRVQEVGGRVIGVGDPAQLAAVGAGGMFASMIQHPRVETVEFETVWRFHNPAEGAASLGLRTGRADAVGWYRDHGRVVEGGTRAETVDVARRAWREAESAGDVLVVMAERRSSVTEIASGIQADRVDAGLVTSMQRFDSVDGEVLFGVGDYVVACRNDRRIVDGAGKFVANGDRFTVTGFEYSLSRKVVGVHAEDADGRVVTVPTSYVEAGHLDLAYAVTTHKAQGATVDRGLMIVDSGTSREALYVGMTRGRALNVALVVTADVRDDAHAPEIGVEGANAIFTAAAGRQRSEDAAIDVLAKNRPSLSPGEVRSLAAAASPAELQAWANEVGVYGNADVAEQLLETGPEPATAMTGAEVEAMQADLAAAVAERGPRIDPPAMPGI